jgi:hypothetical protein
MLMDFSNNKATGFSEDGSHAYMTQVVPDYDYTSMNAESHGTLPAQRGRWKATDVVAAKGSQRRQLCGGTGGVLEVGVWWRCEAAWARDAARG